MLTQVAQGCCSPVTCNASEQRLAQRGSLAAAPSLRQRSFAGRQLQQAVTNGCKCRAFFKNLAKLRTNSQDAGVYASQTRDDFTEDDVEHYFNYMGMLATEGTYDRLKQLLDVGLHPVDLLLLMAAKENDFPRVAELLRAGAKTDVTGLEGKLPRELTTNPDIVDLLANPKKAFQV